MYLINSARRTGKTSACIELLFADPCAMVVVASHADVDNFIELAAERRREHMRVLLDRVVAVSELKEGYTFPKGALIAVDDVNRVLATVLGHMPSYGTITADVQGVTRTVFGFPPCV